MSVQFCSCGWSILNRQAPFVCLYVIMAVPEEIRFVVSLMVSLLPRQIEKRGYCSVALALLCQSTSEVV